MADVNKTVADLQSIANDGYLTIQPTTSQEYMIVNIYAAGAAEVYKYDGSLEVLVDSAAAQNTWATYKFFLTNADYLRIKNVSGTTSVLGYDGVRTA